ncbi:MAG: tail fiber protein [Verrucomicrobiota bacterium]
MNPLGPIQPRPRYRRRARTRAAAPPAQEDVIVTGAVLPYCGATAPAGYLQCDGSAVSRTTYAALFAVMGTAYGAGDGSTTFNVPDFRGRTLLGAGTGAGLSNRTRGQTGGAETITLALDQIPLHQHGYTQATGITPTGGEVSPGMGASVMVGASLDSSAAVTDQAGGTSSHDNMIPFGVAMWIVKS